MYVEESLPELNGCLRLQVTRPWMLWVSERGGVRGLRLETTRVARWRRQRREVQTNRVGHMTSVHASL